MVDRVGDAAAAGLALGGRATLGDAGALAGGEKGAPVRLRRERTPGGQRREETDQDRLMDEIDRQAVAAGEADARAPAPTGRASGPAASATSMTPGNRASAEAEKDDARPRQERAPVERVRQRLAESDPQEPGRIEQTSSG